MVTKRDNRQPTTDNRQGEYRAICLWKMVTGQAEFCNKATQPLDDGRLSFAMILVKSPAKGSSGLGKVNSEE